MEKRVGMSIDSLFSSVLVYLVASCPFIICSLPSIPNNLRYFPRNRLQKVGLMAMDEKMVAWKEVKAKRAGRMQASTLRHVADEILANSAYAQASVRIGETLRQAGGYLRA